MGWHRKSSAKNQHHDKNEKVIEQQQQQQQQQQQKDNESIVTLNKESIVDPVQNAQNINKTIVLKNGQIIQTLLAKALYDNLADAPDELSFRKGDIVTVIEQDVDGLVGWWLCLLHGRQGIVPGNRLKVIPPVELDQLEKTSMKRGSYETDEFSDSTDFIDGNMGGNYDFLPAPVKANNFTSPLSIKDMFDIPYKSNTSKEHFVATNKLQKEEVYDVPSTKNSQEVYDIPKNEKLSGYSTPTNNNRLSSGPQEIYDTPTNNRLSDNLEVYNTPRSNRSSVGPNEVYDIPTNNRHSASHEVYDIPTNNRLSGSHEVYDVPTSNRLSGSHEVYDVPTSNRLSGSHEVYDVPTSNRLSGSHEVYDVPTSNRLSGSHEVYDVPSNSTSQEVYDIPSKKVSHEIYDIPTQPNTQKSSLNNVTTEFYDVPNVATTGSVLEVDKLMGEIYDSPFNNDDKNTIKRSPKNSQSNTPRNSMNVGGTSEIYDVPKSTDGQTEEIIDMVNKLSSQAPMNTQLSSEGGEVFIRKVYEETYDVPVSSKTLKRTPKKSLENTPRSAQTLPRGFSPKKDSNNQVKSGGFLKEIYDIPGTLNRNPYSSEQNTPTVLRKMNSNFDEDNGPHEGMQDVYDIPSNNTLKRSQVTNVEPEVPVNPSNDDLYDVPVHHNVNQVMANVTNHGGAYEKHQRNVSRTLNGNTLVPPGGLEDDYVDYHDIWSQEPPKELVREHVNSISKREDLQPPLSPTSRRRLSSEQKKSILDQINFEAVKELHITTSEALDRLSKLHLAVDTCVTTLTTFCTQQWLDITVLKSTVQPIRDYSGKLKTALRLLTEFGLGTLVNTTKNIDGEILMDKLIGDVEPLLESYYKIKICLMHLDSNNWIVPDVRTSVNDKFFATLNAIMILSQRIPDQCRLFNLAVQNNVEQLFTPDPVENITKQIGDLVTQVHADILPTGPPPNLPLRSPSKKINQSPMEVRQRSELAGRRQQAREGNSGTLPRPVPKLPPKPSLPHQRRSLAGTIEEPDLGRQTSLTNRGFGHIERLVTDFVPDNSRQKKYASDPATPSHTDGQKVMWGGSCPVLLERNSAAVYSSFHDSTSSTSSVGASIPEEMIVIKQTNQQNIEMNRSYPSDSNILSPTLSPQHIRSASLPWDDKKILFTYDEPGTKTSISPLDHRDIESLEFFCRQVESQVMLLREAMKNLTEAVENREEPAVFVSHSKFIILTAHKVVNGGQEITGRLLNQDVQSKIKNSTAHLTTCIRGVVASTKSAALEYPEPSSMMEMISSVLALGDAVRIIHSECRRALDA